ncbi:hypothetical protein TNIN_421291, partial [Trichonephila inaurata madagascariensis]
MLTHAFWDGVTPSAIFLARGAGRPSNERHVVEAAEINDGAEARAGALY